MPKRSFPAILISSPLRTPLAYTTMMVPWQREPTDFLYLHGFLWWLLHRFLATKSGRECNFPIEPLLSTFLFVLPQADLTSGFKNLSCLLRRWRVASLFVCVAFLQRHSRPRVGRVNCALARKDSAMKSCTKFQHSAATGDCCCSLLTLHQRRCLVSVVYAGAH